MGRIMIQLPTSHASRAADKLKKMQLGSLNFKMKLSESLNFKMKLSESLNFIFQLSARSTSK